MFLTVLRVATGREYPETLVRSRGEMILAWKPNLAHLADPTWQPDFVRRYLTAHLRRARDGACIVEIHLKDISTVHHEPRRLWEWARIAEEVSAQFA